MMDEFALTWEGPGARGPTLELFSLAFGLGLVCIEPERRIARLLIALFSF